MRLVPFALLLASLLAIPALGIDITPAAPLPGAGPYAEDYGRHQHRFLEAQTKGRLMALMAAGEEGRTANMEQYDVTYYDLEMELLPQFQLLEGVATIVARVVDGPLANMELNLRTNMTVSGVLSGGLPVTRTHLNSLLTVNLDRAYETGETVTVEVTYGGNPQSDAFGWDSYNGDPLIWTLSEPYGARRWWPCKDLNTDKADSVDLHVTVDDELIVASNGLLVDETVPVPGKKTYHWSTRYPIPTYLVSLAVHPYTIFSQSYTGLDGTTTMPVDNYVLPSFYWQAQSGYAPTVSMLEVFAQGFGEYPFIEEKYGHAHFPWGGGMEHQTISSMSYSYYAETFIAHELGHQWWGDMVTCADFGHIWLNEGFATWSEAYWREMNEGVAAYRSEMNQAVYYGGGTIFVEDPSNFSSIFDYYLSYQKASWVVHMLRGVLGDDDFFTGLQQYREAFEYDSATTEQFRDIMEQASGRDLDSFFQQWIYGEGYPQYVFNWTHSTDEDGQHVHLRIEQGQPGQVFDMPIQVRLQNPLSNQIYTVENSQRVQWYHFQPNGQVLDVELDPDGWILCEKEFGGISEVPPTGPAQPRLLANVPNPFNPSTEIRFELPAPALVDIGVYDLSGRLVKRLLHEDRAAGPQSVRWDGRDAAGRRQASGAYFVRMDAGGKTGLRKITLVQ